MVAVAGFSWCAVATRVVAGEDSKPPPVSAPLSSPTPALPDKGVIGPETGPVGGISGGLSGQTIGQGQEWGLADGPEWADPLLTHRIFSGRDGRVYISRDIAPDPEFWAGVGVAGCESEWRAAVDSPTGDTGFFQINRWWQEGRVLRRGWTWEDMKDPEKNTEIAYEMWLEQSWSPWAARDCVGRSMGISEGGF